MTAHLESTAAKLLVTCLKEDGMDAKLAGRGHGLLDVIEEDPTGCATR
jgi:hypothetical protein